ncbi:uncharacterized protein LOC119092393 [Pollicipes pollicipes]|uniref:uncharacterized protein LOC119092393 n=1 Tax=Pollicipes pollicipes TaxID=41117 RepID=UPI00188527BE|nr:uncharacterized protein LOC119092393 [Pollicipes pollicipes]
MAVDMLGTGVKSKDAALSPLKYEYEHTIESLKTEISKFWEEQGRLQTQVREVTTENEALNAQLRDVSSKVTLAPLPQNVGHQQQQLDALSKERDSAVQLWQTGLKEVERLEAALAAARTDDTDERWRRYTEQVRAQYAQAVSSLSGELARQREAAERGAAEQARAEEAGRAAELDLVEARERCVQLSGREAEALDKLREGVDVVQNALLEKEEAVQKAERLEGRWSRLRPRAVSVGLSLTLSCCG